MSSAEEHRMRILSDAYDRAYGHGRKDMKADILAMVNTCLDRDPTLQKLVKQIEDMT